MSISNSINNNKALFLLKNFGELKNRFTINDLQNPIESFIDKSLGNTYQVFEKFIKDKEQQKNFLEKNTSTAQQWRLIFAIYPDFCQSSLENIFHAAIQAAPNPSVEEAQQVFTCLKENQGTDLNQIYTDRYSTQFLTWMQDEVYTLPSHSILLLLKIWQNFGNQSIDETWKILLSLSEWDISHREALDIFKLKHDFMVKNYVALQHIKLKAAAPTSKVVESVKSMPKQHLKQYVLWAKALDYLLEKIANVYGLVVLGFKKGSWEYQLLYTPREISSKILSWRAKKISSFYQGNLRELIEFFDEKIKPVKEAREKVNELEYILENLKQGTLVYLDTNVKEIKTISKKQIKKYEKNETVSKEQVEIWLKNWKKAEKSLQIELKNFIGFRQDISNIKFIMEELAKSFIEPKQEIGEDQIMLIEKNQRELIQIEHEFISLQNKSKKAFSIEILDSNTEAIETLNSSDSESKTTVFHLPPVSNLSFVEIDAFLKGNRPVNGFLSKSIDGILRQLKMHLLKIQTSIPNELKALRKEKINEIHTQLTIATAALELIIQAIEDQRFDHVVLGFRSGLIHCHFAVEQMLSLKILLENHEITNTHDLIDLAKKANVNTFKGQKEFLKNIGIHLWFCYPKDYQFFYPEKSKHPKTFLFLQKLLHPHKERTEKRLATLQEAIQLYFTMYSQTIEFIREASSVPQEDLNKFLKKISEVQNQIQIGNGSSNTHFIKDKSSILEKCNQALTFLNEMDQLDNIQDLKKELFLPLNTIKEYLKLIKISLEIPQESKDHCLQEFIQVETLVNMDKLFKNLFRTIILLQTEDDNHSHDLSVLFQFIKNFYIEGLLTRWDEDNLKELNLSITHHYLHKHSCASLKKDYKNIFDLAQKLNLLSEKDCIFINQGHSISYKTLRTKIGKIFKKIDAAFDLFIKLLNPVITEIQLLNNLS